MAGPLVGPLVRRFVGAPVGLLVSAPVGLLGGRSKLVQLGLETGHRLQ